MLSDKQVKEMDSPFEEELQNAWSESSEKKVANAVMSELMNPIIKI